MNDKSQAPALSRGLEILEHVSRCGEQGFKALEDHFGYNVSSLNRYLRTLLEMGYLRKNANGRYELGIGAFQLSLRNSFWKLLVSNVTPVLERLSDELKLTASLIGYLDKEMTVLAKAVSSDNVMLRKVGEAKSDYLLSPWGYLYVAELAPPERKAFLETVRGLHDSQYDLPDDATVDAIVSRVKASGYADDQGGILGRRVRRLAAPIHAGNQLVGALVVSSFAALMNDDEAIRVGRILVPEAKAISDELR